MRSNERRASLLIDIKNGSTYHFLTITCPLFVLAITTSVSTKLIQNNLQTASRINLGAFLKYFSHTCHVYHWKSLQIQSLSFSFSRRSFIKTASAIQYKSRYKSRSVVAPMNTRTYKSAILKTILGTHFWVKNNGWVQSSYIESVNSLVIA